MKSPFFFFFFFSFLNTCLHLTSTQNLNLDPQPPKKNGLELPKRKKYIINKTLFMVLVLLSTSVEGFNVFRMQYFLMKIKHWAVFISLEWFL